LATTIRTKQGGNIEVEYDSSESVVQESEHEPEEESPKTPNDKDEEFFSQDD